PAVRADFLLKRWEAAQFAARREPRLVHGHPARDKSGGRFVEVMLDLVGDRAIRSVTVEQIAQTARQVAPGRHAATLRLSTGVRWQSRAGSTPRFRARAACDRRASGCRTWRDARSPSGATRRRASRRARGAGARRAASPG